MASLADYQAFIAVAERASLTAAARHLGRSLQAVSRALGALERELGVELVQRTTRRARLTDAGTAFLPRIKAALADIELARSAATEQGGRIAGRLRVTASVLYAPIFLVPAAAIFMERHPAIEIELVLADRYVDLVAERVDLAIRIGEMPDTSLVARRLGAHRVVVFGAPGYFAKRGRPSAPGELPRHACVLRTSSQEPDIWTFRRGGRTERIEVNGRFRADNAASCNEAAAQGLGIGMAPLWQVARMVEQGRLELVLTDYEPPAMPIHAVWPAAIALPARLRSFIDFLAARFPV